MTTGARGPAHPMTRTTRRRAALAAAALATLLAATRAAADGWIPPDFAYAAGALPGEAATPVPLAPPDGAAAPAPADGPRARLVAAARARVGRPFRGDCSGFVLALLRDAGLRAELPPARSRSEALWLGGAPVEVPRPGDLAFFHDTYDRDRDGRLDDRFTHVALVEEVRGERVTLLHRGLRGVERIRMDLGRPSDTSSNDRLRIPRKGEPRGTRHLAGELLGGFGALAP